MVKRVALPRLIAFLAALLSIAYMISYAPSSWDPPRGIPESVRRAPFHDVGVVGVYVSALVTLVASYWAAIPRVWAHRTLFWSVLAMGSSSFLSGFPLMMFSDLYFPPRAVASWLCFAWPAFFLAVLLRHPAVSSTFRSQTQGSSAPTI